MDGGYLMVVMISLLLLLPLLILLPRLVCRRNSGLQCLLPQTLTQTEDCVAVSPFGITAEVRQGTDLGKVQSSPYGVLASFFQVFSRRFHGMQMNRNGLMSCRLRLAVSSPVICGDRITSPYHQHTSDGSSLPEHTQ